MKIRTDDLIKIYRSYVQEQVPKSRRKCLSHRAMMNLFAAPGSKHKKGRVVDHITSCRLCAQEFGFFLEIHREEGLLLKEIDRILPQRKWLPQANQKNNVAKISRRLEVFCRRPSFRYAALLLLVTIAIAASILLTHQFVATQKNIERGRTPGQILLMAPAHGKAVRAPLIFQWKFTGKYEYAVLEIFDEALSPICKSPRIYKDFYQFPPEIETKIEKNKICYWMITIFLIDGKIVESRLEHFVLIE